MGIYKVEGKKGESWGIDFYDNGRRIKKIIGTRKDAEHSLSLLKADSLRGELSLIKKSDMGFRELAEKYLEYGETNGKKSLVRDGCSVKALLGSFEYFKISQISPLHIENYKKRRLEEKRKPATVNRELSCLKHMFALARKWKIARENPASEVKLLKEEECKMRVLEKVEAELLIDAAAEYLKPILITALSTALRRGELLKLTWNDVDFVNCSIRVRNTKSGKDRVVPMNSLVAETLKEQDMSDEFVFPSKEKRERFFESVSRDLRATCGRVGIGNFRFHDLRHTAASWMVVDGGIDLVTVKEILGHSEIKMTMVYCHASRESKRKAVEVLGKLLSTPAMVRKGEEKLKNGVSLPQ